MHCRVRCSGEFFGVETRRHGPETAPLSRIGKAPKEDNNCLQGTPGQSKVAIFFWSLCSLSNKNTNWRSQEIRIASAPTPYCAPRVEREVVS